MKCGQEIRVKDPFGTIVLQFIAQCDNMFIIIARPAVSYLNGYRVFGWQALVRELIALVVPAKLTEKRHDAESTASGQYVHVPLTYPLSVDGLAKLFDAPPDEMRIQLADLAVQMDPPYGFGIEDTRQ